MPRESLTRLRRATQRIARLSEPSPAARDRLALGVPRIDAWLDGGLRAEALHELRADALEDGASALGFALLLAQMKAKEAGALIWAREDQAVKRGGAAYGPGLVALGIDPAALTLLHLPDAKAVLRAGLDAVRSASIAALLIELNGRQPTLDLTATRRLALAAAETGTLILLVRAQAGEAGPTVAQTRWQVAAAPSTAPPPGDVAAPGAPAFTLTLLRQRGGREGLSLILEWNRDTGAFREPDALSPLSGAVLPMAAGGTRARGRPRAA